MIFWLSVSEQSEEAEEPSDAGEAYIRECVSLAALGNAEAFEILVELYREEIFGVAWRLTRNTEDALDVVQDVFIRAYRALKSYRGNSRFSTWLHRIAVTTALDYLRHERRYREGRVYEQDDEGQGERSHQLFAGTTAANQADEVQKKQIHDALKAALAKLPHRQREVIVLRYFHELSLPEIAKVLRCHVGSVKSHLFRAQKRLRIMLKDWESDAS